MPDEDQLEQFKQAVDEKNEAAEARAEDGAENPRESSVDGDQETDQDARKKSSRAGQVTADKWNQ